MNAPARAPGGRPSGTHIASIDRAALHRSIVTAATEAIREGVHVRHLDGLQAYTDLSRLVVVRERAARIEQLRQQRDAARRKARAARDLAIDETDPGVRADYRADARRWATTAQTVDEEIESLQVQVDPDRLPDALDGEVGYLLAGLRSLLSSDGCITQDERAALTTVLRDFHAELVGPEIHWSVTLLVPADARVLALGPITGTVPSRGRIPTPAEIDAVAVSNDAPLQRRDLRIALTRAGYPEALAGAASMAPGPHLVAALLGEDVRWPDCEPGFDHLGFAAHLRETWTALQAWSGGVYAHTAPKRQILADLVAALGGHATLAQLHHVVADVGLKPTDLYPMTLPRPSNGGQPPWPPTVDRVGTWSAGTLAEHSHLTSPRCPRCGQPATAVVRVPEVPTALLCRGCRVMPGHPDLVFPPLYLDLALPPITIPDDLVHRAHDLPTRVTHKGPKRRGEKS